MTNDGERPPNRIAGLPLDDAVDAVVARDESRSPDEVRRVLSTVATDGVVSWEGVDDAVAHLSKVVSTPETRVELAALELAEAREVADPVTDIDLVRTRLDTFEARLDAVERRVDALGTRLQALLDDDTSGLYETAVEIHELTAAANDAQGAADELQMDLEAFQRWLTDPERRCETFDEELDALGASLDDLSAVVDDVSTAIDEADASTGPAVAWFDTLLRYRALAPLFGDLRSELVTLRRWDDREAGGTADELSTLDGRLDDLRERWTTDTARLERLGRPAWHDRFDDRLSSVEAAVDAAEPPVDWGTISAALDEARAGLDELD